MVIPIWTEETNPRDVKLGERVSLFYHSGICPSTSIFKPSAYLTFHRSLLDPKRTIVTGSKCMPTVSDSLSGCCGHRPRPIFGPAAAGAAPSRAHLLLARALGRLLLCLAGTSASLDSRCRWCRWRRWEERSDSGFRVPMVEIPKKGRKNRWVESDGHTQACQIDILLLDVG